VSKRGRGNGFRWNCRSRFTGQKKVASTWSHRHLSAAGVYIRADAAL